MNGKMGLIEIKYWCANVSCSKRNNNMFVKQKIILFKTQNNLKKHISLFLPKHEAWQNQYFKNKNNQH